MQKAPVPKGREPDSRGSTHIGIKPTQALTSRRHFLLV